MFSLLISEEFNKKNPDYFKWNIQKFEEKYMHKRLKKLPNQEDLLKQLVEFFIVEKLAKKICDEFC